MFTVGSFSSFEPSGGWYMCRYIDMFSSRPQLAETWSIMMLPIGLPPQESLRSPTQVSPRRNRMLRITTSCDLELDRVAGDAHAVARRGAAVDRDVRRADANLLLEPDDAGHVEHDDPRPARFAAPRGSCPARCR